MVAARFGGVSLVVSVLVACSSSSSPTSDAGAAPDAQTARVAQGASCQEYLRCLARSTPEAVGPAVLAYGPDSGCWANAETAGLCEGACTDGRQKVGCATPEAGASETVEGLYYGSCLTSLAVGDLNKVLRFYTEVRFVPSAGGGDSGKLDLQLTALRSVDFATGQPVPAAPASVSKGQTVGAAFGTKANPVATGGRFAMAVPSVTLDKNANAISGREIAISNLVIDGSFRSSGRFCSTFGGQVTAPINQPISPTESFCVFVPVKGGDPVPSVKREEYTCKP